LRWFTPTVEIDLCGHATVASAFVLFEESENKVDEIRFKTRNGLMKVTRRNGLLYLDFPSRPVQSCEIYATFEKAFGVKPIAVYKAADFLVLLDSEETLRNIRPDYSVLRKIKAEAALETDLFGIIITAKGNDCDFVSRFFAPNMGIEEDPVTGRAHCSLIPFWSNALGKNKLNAKQLSKRGGVLFCEDAHERVIIGGKAVKYSQGEINI
jgi:PhzF family phenazine biosynthesis protein